MMNNLVDFLDGGAGTAGTGSASGSGHATGHSSGHAARSAAGRLIQLGNDRVADALDLLELVLVLVLFGRLVAIEPLDA